ncbi:MAG: P63C domain-containing protein [Opitutales bacterium]
MSKNSEDSMQSKGGKARAKKLSPEQRRAIAEKAAATRWGTPKATHEADIEIGDMKIPCAVLEDGTRILSQSGFLRALGRSERPAGGVFEETLRIISANNLKPFISRDLAVSMNPIEYIPKAGGKALGFRADLLPQVCEVYLAARQAIPLHHTQRRLAEAAELIMRGLARLGITALIDEATGYQYDRARNALANILEKFIAKELRAWTKTFPADFYEEIFRLNGWKFDPSSVARPGVIGTWTNDIVYKRLAPGVLDELRAKTPRTPAGNRKHRYFQWLSGDVGHPKLLAHIEGLRMLMKVSESWEEFRERLDKFYPMIETTELGFEVEIRK